MATPVLTNVAGITSQFIIHIEEILNANPLKPGEKGQMIKIAEDDTISLFVVRAIEGFLLESHFHKSHAETVCVIKGTGQVLANDKWVDIKPGSLHFNPPGNTHSTKHTGHEPLVVISIFTPALKEPDRHFAE
jgi:mannose-6-phosphate isomerase-like protein (cupin superfamily)